MITNSKNDRAIIAVDIGSNSIRSQRACLTGDSFVFSEKSVFTTRLAKGLLQTGLLSEEAEAASFEVIALIAREAAGSGLPVYCYATSAVRDAKNGPDFMKRLTDELHIRAEIIPGKSEAYYARMGAGIAEGGLIDIGGGSFQISSPAFADSFPLGCIRAKDICGAEETLALLEKKTAPVINGHLETVPALPGLEWKAVGGTATTLACMLKGFDAEYDPGFVATASVDKNGLMDLLGKIESIPMEKRRVLPLLRSRADVILGGGFILYRIMEHFGISGIGFSDRDGLEGYAMHILNVL